MDEPILLVKKEFEKDIVSLINSSKLPLVLIEPILKDLLNDARLGLEKQYEQEKEAYEEYLNEKEAKENVVEQNKTE